MADLKRQLGLLDSTMINVGTIIASAIFIVPSAIAATLQATGPAILVWIVGGVVSLLGALSVAELGAAMPHAGGQYVYLTRAYGPASGFLYGWTSGVVTNPASISAIAVGFATYFGFFVPLAGAGIKLVAVLSIVALTVLNSLGVRLGAVTQNVLTLIKMGLLVVLIVVGFVLPGGSVANLTPLWSDAPLGHQIASFGVALVARRLRCGAGHARRRRCRARRPCDHDRDHRVEQRHRAHGGACSLRDGAGRSAAGLARRCASAVPHPGAVALRAGNHLDRAHVDLHGAIVEGHVQSAVHLRRPGRIHLLRHVGRRGDPAAAHRRRPAPSLPHLGLSRHAAPVRPVLRVAHL